MNKILIEHKPSAEKLAERDIENWPIWEKGPSSFPWRYDSQETCYVICGRATVTPDDGGEAVEIIAGDLVIFPAGLACHWDIHEDIRKHYCFE